MTMKQIGWAYRHQNWKPNRWHVCGMDSKPTPGDKSEVKPVYIEDNKTCFMCGAPSTQQTFDEEKHVCSPECNSEYYKQQCIEFVENYRDLIGAGYGMGHQTTDLFRILKARNEAWDRLEKEDLKRRMNPPPEPHVVLADRLETEVKPLDDTPPSLQTQANIRLINAVHEAAAILRGTPSSEMREVGNNDRNETP